MTVSKQPVGHAVRSVVGGCAAAPLGSSLSLAGLVILAPPRSAATVAGVDLAPAAAAFKSGETVYVYPGGDALVDPAAAAKIKSAIGASKVHVAVIAQPADRPGRRQAVGRRARARTRAATAATSSSAVGGRGTFTDHLESDRRPRCTASSCVRLWPPTTAIPPATSSSWRARSPPTRCRPSRSRGAP